MRPDFLHFLGRTLSGRTLPEDVDDRPWAWPALACIAGCAILGLIALVNHGAWSW